jgi:hypothetical protein
MTIVKRINAPIQSRRVKLQLTGPQTRLTLVGDLLVALQRMHDSRARLAEREPADAVREVVVAVREERGDVHVAARQRQRPPGRDVEVAGHLV